MDTDVLADIAGRMGAQATRLDSTTAHGERVAGAVGDAALAEALGGFSSAWSAELSAVVEEIRAVAAAFAHASTTLAGADRDVADVLGAALATVSRARRTGLAREAV